MRCARALNSAEVSGSRMTVSGKVIMSPALVPGTTSLFLSLLAGEVARDPPDDSRAAKVVDTMTGSSSVSDAVELPAKPLLSTLLLRNGPLAVVVVVCDTARVVVAEVRPTLVLPSVVEDCLFGGREEAGLRVTCEGTDLLVGCVGSFFVLAETDGVSLELLTLTLVEAGVAFFAVLGEGEVCGFVCGAETLDTDLVPTEPGKVYRGQSHHTMCIVCTHMM